MIATVLWGLVVPEIVIVLFPTTDSSVGEERDRKTDGVGVAEGRVIEIGFILVFGIVFVS